jgi:hypothetical protein
VLSLLVGIGFQVLFHSPPGVLFTFPSRYSFAIGHWVVFSLGGWSPRIPTGFLVSRGTPDTAQHASHFAYRAVTSSGAAFLPSSAMLASLSAVHTPRVLLPAVWALPRSLAATWGIDVSFFSSGYLDVSVRRVPSRTLWIHVRVTASSTAGFPHSDIHGSKPACGSPWLFAACCVLRRLPVPRHSPYALFRLILIFEIAVPLLCFLLVLSLLLLSMLFSRCVSSGAWWAQVDSNHRPHAYQACALTS